MTHLLVPFDYIEKRIEWLTELRMYSGKIQELNRVVSQSKHVALSDEDIDAEVKLATNRHNLNGWEQHGYRLALKDLMEDKK